ncbi:MAG: MBL fold metallo-hydrolase [Candidatus Saganbacteria bacterium]|nr:MBL fold metallo-hydrolase [Candidatus Saganbacteria bacterium]
MKIHNLKVGPIDTNCYLVEDETTKECLIIDPGDDAGAISQLIEKKQLKPAAIVITHGHWDHVGANKILKEKYNLPIMMSEEDVFGLKMTDSPAPDQNLKEDDEIKAGGLVFKVLQTPGHSPGGISLYSKEEKVVFTGDTLFKGAYGRVDLPGSSPESMVFSLKKLLALPRETKVYPGHGQTTTIGAEQDLPATAR